jgi:hypothetical protein
LARLVHLGDLRNQVGELLRDLAARGPVAVVTVLCGLGGIAVGLLLLVGRFWPRHCPPTLITPAPAATVMVG